MNDDYLAGYGAGIDAVKLAMADTVERLRALREKLDVLNYSTAEVREREDVNSWRNIG